MGPIRKGRPFVFPDERLSVRVLLLLFACNSDTCHQLCAGTAQALDRCLGEWGATWEDFDATERVVYGDRCRAQWEAERLGLELRQIEAANQQCTEAAIDLEALDCVALRALYFDP